MTLRDWATYLTIVGGALAWIYTWAQNRQLKAELRGVRGWKFRAMWRQYAEQHDIPVNGEDSK